MSRRTAEERPGKRSRNGRESRRESGRKTLGTSLAAVPNDSAIGHCSMTKSQEEMGPQYIPGDSARYSDRGYCRMSGSRQTFLEDSRVFGGGLEANVKSSSSSPPSSKNLGFF
ncbi:hypothetical protein L6452_03664 [Arctium lappa]|uniref:Uncharacterized protein n=1 Tax=Arctium lappa TaxID=4217 RepID=A0ACB9FM97_ARCLA|nr:hypothetical protein L6452_03664 [Arctium lappa]